MLSTRLNKDVLVFDGGLGTMLQDCGLKAGDIPEYLNIDNPELLINIHLQYLQAGADFVTTNTFGANPLKLDQSKYRYEDVIIKAVANAREAIKRNNDCGYVAYDIGPVGKLMEPMGPLTFDDVYNSVYQQISLVKDDIDVVLLETMTDIYEVKAAVLAVKEACDLPVFVTMTFETNKRTLSGCDPETMVNILEGLNVDALGINCSLGPKEITPILDIILEHSTIPVMIQPNAGLPVLVNGKTCYNIEVSEFVNECINHVNNGVAIVGGCCGTNPEFIKSLKQNIISNVIKRDVVYKTKVSSGTNTVKFDRVVVCGERLNPTGKKKLKAALKEERYDELVVEAIKQDQAGAHALDVNVGLPGIDEVSTMKHVIKLLQEVISLPLQIDSSNPQAIEQACRYYNGKPLINSVNGKEETMEAIFPIVKKYGGIVIGLTLDENGIPPLANQRLEIAKKIIKKAESYGIRKEDIIIDCLVLTASAQQKEVMETIKAVNLVKQLGVHTVLGVSNVSFGLPNRTLLNKTFLTMALAAGLDLPIINPLDKELMNTIAAYNVLSNQDKDSSEYIATQSDIQVVVNNNSSFTLEEIVLHGLKDEAAKATKSLLEEKDGLEIINEILIPALDKIGKDYETNKIFLPQLIQAAETSKVAFEIIQNTFTGEKSNKGPIVLATVHGDIHDIGKNIVKVVLESYGFEVIDLGKDVPATTVLEAFKKHHPKAIGLSALMTTTVISMQETIALLQQEQDICPIFVGGAVLTEDYAKEINADYYAQDAMASVEICEQIVKQ